MLICDSCKKKIDYKKTRADGIPSGITFEVDDNKVVTLCAACIIALDKMDSHSIADLAQELGIKQKKGA